MTQNKRQKGTLPETVQKELQVVNPMCKLWSVRRYASGLARL
jgi:hypothetical protein